MSSKLLITGGSGFIGAEVVKLALEKGYIVRNLDLKAPESEFQRYWRQIDIRNFEDVDGAIREFEPNQILHLASDIDVTIASLADFQTTINGTRNVLKVAQKLSSLRTFVHTSTQFVVRPGAPVTSDRDYVPYTLYGEAKAETEKQIWSANLSVDWYIMRPTIIWGPRHPSFGQQIFRYVASRKYLHPVGPDSIIRTFGYVYNTAEQMLKFFELPKQLDNRVFYLGDAHIDYDKWIDAFSVGLTGRPARRIPVQLLKLMGWTGDLVNRVGLKSPIDSGRVFRMSTSSKIDLQKTLSVTGPPNVSFDLGVKKTLEWLETARLER
ncbi:NAD(P)-dependent oxidoreductase [Bradyrhizobium sp. 62B]|uniref:NAD-dependent epimerase/dehydratase family protein n=1 Tax=Bradyrhizobium sp. 62B TaxID=2898442 RepID=UPI00255836E9|nr:NAD(P)-dependent oxidoreductase [Bradyrhizobium sp. 62B]